MNPEERFEKVALARVRFGAFGDELAKIAMSRSALVAASKMFPNASRLRGVGLPSNLRSKIPDKVPRPHQLSGKLAPPSRVPRPNAPLGPSAKAPPLPRQRKKDLFAVPEGPSPFASSRSSSPSANAPPPPRIG